MLSHQPVYALVVATLVVGLVVSPHLKAKIRDDFPLSSYPMFSVEKDRTTRVTQAVAISSTGETPLAPEMVGTDEVLQARALLTRAARRGPEAKKLCAEIAERVAKRGPEAETIVLRTVTHDSVLYFTRDETKPSAVKVHATCPVGSR